MASTKRCGDLMGRRKGRKKRGQLKYSKGQFIDILCRGCNLCGEYVDAEFCYDYCYKSSSINFINRAYKELIRMREWPFQVNNRDSLRTLKNEMKIFRKVFCDSNCCTPDFDEGHSGRCIHLYQCMSKFREQIEDSSDPHEVVTSHVPRRVKKRKKKKKKQKKVVVEAYPTFVMSGSDVFQARVRRILYGKTNRDSNVEQVGDKELSCGSVAGSNG